MVEPATGRDYEHAVVLAGVSLLERHERRSHQLRRAFGITRDRETERKSVRGAG
eukprot:COSAG03_NODE_23890_length_276_cov_0.796610_1_plen_53_part_10